MSDLFDYVSLAKNAEALIRKFGDECKIVTYTDVPAPNPIDPPTRTPVKVGTRGVWGKFKLEDIDNVNILQADQRVLLAGRLIIDSRAVIERGSEQWKIIAVERVKPGPTSVLWKVQVRQ